MKETAIRMIQKIPDDKIIHVLHFLQGIHGLYEDSGVADIPKQAALRRLRQ
jgi:hypothetical protein